MNQDRGQKAQALRYVVAKGWLPQLELDVSTYMSTSQSAKNITDVDVFAAIPDDFVGFRGLAIDCKTKKNESPISRALWQRGLLERLRIERGICVLRTSRIETDHRYTAAQLGVTLLAESEFEAFARATAPDFQTVSASIAEIDRWDLYFAIGNRYPALQPAITFSKSGYWMSDSDAEACVRTIFLLNRIRGELDPAVPEHLAVVFDVLSLFLHSLSRIVVKVFGEYLQPGQREALSTALLHLLYGGRGTYIHLNRIKRMLASGATTRGEIADEHPAVQIDTGFDDGRIIRAQTREFKLLPADRSAAGDRAARELSLPEWDRFVELVRQMLDAPLESTRAPLLTRELAWSCFGTGVGPDDGVTSFARKLALRSPQGARFAVLALSYLCKAGRLPIEFESVLTNRLLTAQSK